MIFPAALAPHFPGVINVIFFTKHRSPSRGCHDARSANALSRAQRGNWSVRGAIFFHAPIIWSGNIGFEWCGLEKFRPARFKCGDEKWNSKTSASGDNWPAGRIIYHGEGGMADSMLSFIEQIPSQWKTKATCSVCLLVNLHSGLLACLSHDSKFWTIHMLLFYNIIGDLCKILNSLNNKSAKPSKYLPQPLLVTFYMIYRIYYNYMYITDVYKFLFLCFVYIAVT